MDDGGRRFYPVRSRPRAIPLLGGSVGSIFEGWVTGLSVYLAVPWVDGPDDRFPA